MGLFLVVMAAVAGFVALQMVSKARRSAAVARVGKPEAVRFYEALAARTGSTAATSDRATPEAAPSDGSPSAAEIVSAAETLARYEAFWSRRYEALAGSAEWGHLVRLVIDRPVREWSEADRERLEELVEAHQDLIRELRELAELGGPVCPLDLSRGMEIELPHLAKLRDCARLLMADAQVKAASGDYSTAVADLAAGLHLVDALAPEPILLSQLIRMALCGVAMYSLQRTFAPGELPTASASQILRQLADMDHRDALAASLAGEMLFGLQFFSDLRAGSGASLLGEEDGAESVFAEVYANPLARLWFNRDQATYVETMERYLEAVPLPYHEAKPLLDEIERPVEDLPMISEILLPALGRVCLAQARTEAWLDVAQLGLALELHYADTGEYPATLDAAAIAYLGEAAPVDPFTGQSYLYRPSANTFLLYSVGQDLEDDGGMHDLREGDIVWRGREGP